MPEHRYSRDASAKQKDKVMEPLLEIDGVGQGGEITFNSVLFLNLERLMRSFQCEWLSNRQQKENKSQVYKRFMISEVIIKSSTKIEHLTQSNWIISRDMYNKFCQE